MRSLRYKLVALAAASTLVVTGCSNESTDTASSSAASATSAVASKASSATSEASSAASSDSIEVEDNHGTQTIKRPVERIAALDNRTFSVLDEWGVDLVAVPKGLVSPELSGYKNNDDLLDLGMHFEPNFENLVAADPDLIITGQRFGKSYEEIKKLNPETPIVDFEPRDGKDFAEELRREVLELGKILDKEDDAEKMVADFDKAIERAKKAYDPSKTVMATLISGGKIAYIAPYTGRTFGPLYDMIGMTPALEVENAAGDAHGDDISVEAIAQSNPDYIIVMDRDAPLKGPKSAKPADDYVSATDALKGTEALANVTAVAEDHVYYSPMDTYLNESILLYTQMLNELADMFESAA